MKKGICLVVSFLFLMTSFSLTAFAAPVDKMVHETVFDDATLYPVGIDLNKVSAQAPWKEQNSGANGGRMVIGANANEAGTGNAIVSQWEGGEIRFFYQSTTVPIPIEKGKSYELRVRMKSNAGSESPIQVQVLPFNKQPAAYHTYQVWCKGRTGYQAVSTMINLSSTTTYPANTTDWQTVKIPFSFLGIKDAEGNEIDSFPIHPALAFINRPDVTNQYTIESVGIYEIDDGNLTIKVASTANGKVLDGTTDVTGTDVAVLSGGSKTFKLEPDSGYQVAKVMYGSTDITSTVNAQNEVTVNNVTTDGQTLTVTFVQSQSLIPTVAISSNVIQGLYHFDPTKPEYNSFLLYITIGKPDTLSWDSIAYGVVVTDKDGSKKDVTLRAERVTSDGTFGIRAFGAALETGKTYTVKAYVTTSTGETSYSDPKDITIQ